MKFSKIQSQFLKHKLHRINILTGSVRSGKSFIANWKVISKVINLDLNVDGIIAGRSKKTVITNILRPMQKSVGVKNLHFNQEEGWLFGHHFLVCGTGTVASEEAIRGAEFGWAYVDEGTLSHKTFFKMLTTRLSVKDAWLITTTNPDAPSHWLKTEYIDNKKIDVKTWVFKLTDNFALDKNYVKEINAEYVGFFRKRFILGMWVRAEGAIYESFEPERNVINGIPSSWQYLYTEIGGDIGGNGSATSFIAVDYYMAKFRVSGQIVKKLVAIAVDEVYDTLNKDVNSLKEEFKQLVGDLKTLGKKIKCAYIDSAEQLIIKEIRAMAICNIKSSKKIKIMDRIMLENSIFKRQQFFILKKCKNLTLAFESAVWNPKINSNNERLDDGTSNIDSLDAVEYTLERHFKDFMRIGAKAA